MKYCFEKYDHCSKGIIFKGCVQVDACSTEEAMELAQAKAGEHIKLQQVYINPADPYSR
jgi:hypothetical protein